MSQSSLFDWVCPACKDGLDSSGICLAGHGPYLASDGIGRFLLPERRVFFEQFIEDYEKIRRQEKRGSKNPNYYQRLPNADTTGIHSDAWRIRAAGYHALVKHVVQARHRCKGEPLKVLDLGAGNAWLSNQLSSQGHRVAAVDLQTNSYDGLGARVYYEYEFDCVQAEFQHLPFKTGQFDLVIFNASFHYAISYEDVLEEAKRVLCRRGRIVIMDSPLYENPESGIKMVEERKAYFKKNFGFASDAIPSLHYLTSELMRAQSESLDLEWTFHKPRHGLKWKLRPLLASLLRRREPAAFFLIEGQRPLEGAKDLVNLAQQGNRSFLTRSLDKIYHMGYLLFQKGSLTKHSTVRVDGLALDIPSGVFNPVPFKTARLMSDVIERYVRPEMKVLDLGTGSGLGALLAARKGCKVDAVDINPIAVRAAVENAEKNRLSDSIEVHEGDLFEPVSENRYDLILFNPPFFSGSPQGSLDVALRSRDVIDRFSGGLGDRLNSEGEAIVLFSTKGCLEKVLDTFHKHGFYIELIESRNLYNEVLVAMRVTVQK